MVNEKANNTKNGIKVSLEKLIAGKDYLVKKGHKTAVTMPVNRIIVKVDNLLC